MALVENTLFGTVNKPKQAIEWLRQFESTALRYSDAGYYVAYSGGKDSDCIRILCNLAGVKHELYHSHTTVDTPQTVRYVRAIVPPKNIIYPEKSMWQLIVDKKMPPIRQLRYCCQVFKEYGGANRFVVTGVRRAESVNRTNKELIETYEKNKKNRNNFTSNDAIMLMQDNTESRELMEQCVKARKLMLNPIYDWTTEDVWEFLNYYGCKSNPRYCDGCDRIGCIGCPIGSLKHRLSEFERYPKYKENYIRAFDRMLKVNEYDEHGNKRYTWKTGEEVFEWWMSYAPKVDENQITMFNEIAEEEGMTF